MEYYSLEIFGHNNARNRRAIVRMMLAYGARARACARAVREHQHN